MLRIEIGERALKSERNTRSSNTLLKEGLGEIGKQPETQRKTNEKVHKETRIVCRTYKEEKGGEDVMPQLTTRVKDVYQKYK